MMTASNQQQKRTAMANVVHPEYVRRPAESGVANDPRWARVLARDRSADGTFWYSVVTTGGGRHHKIGIMKRGQRAQRKFAPQLRIPPSLSSHRLGWQAEYAHECPPHSFAIRKARLPRDGLDRMST